MFIIRTEECRLLLQTCIVSEFVDSIDPIIDEVEREDLILLHEDNVSSVLGATDILKEKLHACVLELWLVLQDDTVFLLESRRHTIFDVTENEKLVDLLLIADEALATDNGNVLLILACLNGDDLVWLSGILVFKQRDVELVDELVWCLVVQGVLVDFVDVRAKEHVVLDQLEALRSLQVLFNHWDFVVVLILSPVDGEAPLVRLVGDAISDLGSKHHLVAVHVVVHDVFKFWLQRLRVD